MSGSDYHEYSTGHFASKVHDEFSGTVYENEHTATSDAAFRFETSEVKLRDAVILVSTQNALLGDSTNQRYPVAAAATFSMNDVDLSTLYFKNAAAGQNTKVNIIGTMV